MHTQSIFKCKKVTSVLGGCLNLVTMDVESNLKGKQSGYCLGLKLNSFVYHSLNKSVSLKVGTSVVTLTLF